ncbi:glutathione S-transferase B-like [Convolutriloba macropyga]|uniref:glutathione S-transferase B-like n=1 Tax=Convolutriloba macropyga TaxID=536237 RepID=UPI003F521168
MTYLVAYWNIRGFVEPIHLILEYLELPYETKRYEYDNADEWREKDKKNLGLDFPNIPYLIKDDFKMSQSIAIMKYLGRKGGLYPTGSDEEMAIMEQTMETLMDFRVKFAMLCYRPGFEENKVEYLKNVTVALSQFEAWLGAGRKWLNGDNLFVGDFQFWSTLDYHECMEPTVLEAYPNIKKYKTEFESIPQIANYLASDRFKKFPVNGKPAFWGGNAE